LVNLANGDHVHYDRLLIATGSEPRRLPLPGADLAGVTTLRTLADATTLGSELRARAAASERVVIIGAGFIGLELASVARTLGCEVTVFEALEAPLERAIGPRLGAVFAAIHRAHGVDLRLGASVAAFHGHERVEAVQTSAGERVSCALVIVGVGVRPADDWLRGAAGPRLEDGVWVDEFCATTAPGVYAAGDIARWPYHAPDTSAPAWVRLEHFDHALRQGAIAARNLLGERVPYAHVPYFWSEQYGMMLQYVGHATTWDTEVSRGVPGEEPFLHFYLDNGRIVAALAVNRMRDLAPLKKLLGATVSPDVLSSENSDLRALARGLAQA
jgi:3-phenylpropionate/trans-cinnamate dioxygenase ferredoxin reductase subunit